MESDTGAQTLILVHGAGHASRMWRHQRGPLGERFTVLAPDLPGFAGEPGPFSFDAAVAQLATLAAAHRPPVHVCGLSLGAMVAARFAVAHPDLVDRLVLSAPTLVPARSLPRLLGIYRHLPSRVVRIMSDVPDRASWLALVAQLAAFDLTADLPRITTRTLVVCGGRDRARLADAREAAERIPGGRLFVVPHVGHIWPLTAPKVFNAAIGGYLSSEMPTR